eukprot:3116295-Heterocapsa_arctica.AAC.1
MGGTRVGGLSNPIESSTYFVVPSHFLYLYVLSGSLLALLFVIDVLLKGGSLEQDPRMISSRKDLHIS